MSEVPRELIYTTYASPYASLSGAAIRIVQTSEFFCTPDLQLHPFRAQPYVQLRAPPGYSESGDGYGYGYPPIVAVAERLFFYHNEDEWIEDDDQKTDWAPLGLPTPQYSAKLQGKTTTIKVTD